jgi:DNA-binding CsgD family transcriptional regulator
VEFFPILEPFVIRRGDDRLILRHIAHGSRRLVLLREQRAAPTLEDLRSLGLSRRESEVLALVAVGHTDARIAALLLVSPRTVNHTLARVYHKLGANRAAATAKALAARRSA